MYKNGTIFEVVKNGIIGKIDGEASGIYSIVFFQGGQMYYRASVTKGTITENLAYGYWKPLNPEDYDI